MERGFSRIFADERGFFSLPCGMGAPFLVSLFTIHFHYQVFARRYGLSQFLKP